MRQRYGTESDFLVTFNPAKQAEYARNMVRCFTGLAPDLNTLRVAYGDVVCEAWVECQLKDLSEYAGCKDKLSIEQIEQIAKTICLEFGNLKVTELMVFFQRFKGGNYGKFYGAVDGLVITEALQIFREEKCQYLKRLTLQREKREREQRELEREMWKRQNKHKLISKSEWDEISWLFKM